MALKLRVISDHYKALGKRSSRLFGVTGGKIGRAADNDWILPDPDRYISSHHCKVEFRAGQWMLEDTSTNGVFINGSDVPASVEGAYALKDGDRLRLGDYEILVGIDERNDFPPDASGQLPAPVRAAPRRGSPEPEIDLGEELDLTDLLSDAAMKAAEAPRPAANGASSAVASPSAGSSLNASSQSTPHSSPSLLDLNKALGIDLQSTRPGVQNNTVPGRPARSGFTSLLDNPDEPEQRTIAPGRKPDDWQMQTQPYDRKSLQALTNPGSMARPAEKPAATPARRATDGGTLEPANGVEAFCRGAGIDPSSLPLETQHALLQLAGQMTREVVLGLMDVLKGRADQKTRLRLSQTQIQPADNNPLKFSASVDEALLKLLDGHSNTRYLGPVEAIRDSFADLRTHQVALSGAIQAAIDELMNRIEPGELQEKFDRGLKRGALLGAANKMKYWDLYTEFYHVLNQRNEQNLPTLFAEELARTYAERAAQKKR
ncbi:type VI secretion system-associated FHA domain protein TagH [Steroidobacter sp. S1-65]|uniref:Type VI secretion system-associated FHA domain protein TagH n=1 Tax=Steroidobacter gossypii TaxID=2805490 RepID=A0ABS1X1F0_9GAMM|nr:type VI secretion system-associated FHA domain protein TagH [Steroidobacter gossypii]MBM0107055.1 type VI secretion system-associated FHA domain protein TagH [Steroidobacter gossypii]